MGIVEVLEKRASHDGDGHWRHQLLGVVTSAVIDQAAFQITPQ